MKKLIKYLKELSEIEYQQFNQNIESNKKKTEELNQQEINLSNEQNNLEGELLKLGSSLSKFKDLATDIKEEIASQKAAIKMYEEQYNCKDTDEISVCTTKQLPADTSFWRPIKTGHKTSEYGYRRLCCRLCLR